ncbi:uncharacterized protein METZ01_LOCUS334047, partial [marine metagenome]
IFITDLIRQRKSFQGVRVENDLGHASIISHIEKDDPAVITTTMDPATKRDLFTNMGISHLAAEVASHFFFLFFLMDVYQALNLGT